MGVESFGTCWIRIAETIPGRTQVGCSACQKETNTVVETVSYALDADQV